MCFEALQEQENLKELCQTQSAFQVAENNMMGADDSCPPDIVTTTPRRS